MFKALISALLLSAFFISQAAYSHGKHYEVQLESELQVNAQNQLSGVDMIWHYHPTTSQDMLKDEPNLKKLEKTIRSNLERFNFFTKIKSGKKLLVTAPSHGFKLVKIQIENGFYFEAHFSLLFDSPPNLKTVKTLNFEHSDPTTTAIMYYDRQQDLSVAKDLKDKCRTSVKEKPSFNEGEFPQIATVRCG